MIRFRKYRIDQPTRDKFAEVDIHADNLIYPFFIVDGNKIKKAVPGLKDVYHISVDILLEEISECKSLGIDKFLFFGVIEKELKTEDGYEATRIDNLIAGAVKYIKQNFPEVTIITDVCLCGYTTHGHCGIVENNLVCNDRTLPLLAEMALTHANAGADFIAPSSMMDGQVLTIRQALNSRGFENTKILGYSAKFASNFYGPFRHAVASSPSFGNRNSYQVDYRVSKQALAEIDADIKEGVDWIMVKPAHTYLDIIAKTKQTFPDKKLVAYQVSGEYMMIKLAAKAGILDETEAMKEVFYSIKRAGADYIISYYAKDIAGFLLNKK